MRFGNEIHILFVYNPIDSSSLSFVIKRQNEIHVPGSGINFMIYQRSGFPQIRTAGLGGFPLLPQVVLRKE
jgi:hypothetical protein